MGYYSEVAVCLRTEDLKDMVNTTIEEYKKDNEGMRYNVDLLVSGFYQSVHSHAYEDKLDALNSILKDINTLAEFQALHWEWVKWYHDFSDVSWFRAKMESYDYYEEIEIGEDGCTEENRSDEAERYYNLDVSHSIEIRV